MAELSVNVGEPGVEPEKKAGRGEDLPLSHPPFHWKGVGVAERSDDPRASGAIERAEEVPRLLGQTRRFVREGETRRRQ